jgi:hypothetical protein
MLTEVAPILLHAGDWPKCRFNDARSSSGWAELPRVTCPGVSPMQKRTLLAALATAAAAAIVTPSVSQAQDTTRATSKGEVATAPSFGSLMSAINSASANNNKLKAMTDISASNVQLVNVDDVAKGNNTEALTNALKKNDADLTALRTTLGTNTALSGVLTANATPLTAADVVAADVSPDGKVVVYYWKKSS